MYKKISELSPQQVLLIQGSQQTFEALVEDAKKNISFVENQSLSRFTMEDAKRIVSFNLEREKGAWCIVYFDVFMTDASQVLLKTLEEPREDIHIVFVTPHPYLIPQTIRSRARLVFLDIKIDEPEYLSSKKTVLEYIKQTFSSDNDEDASKRRAHATLFLDQIEWHFRENPEKIKYVYEAKDMLFKANMPTKQVVEYLVTMVY